MGKREQALAEKGRMLSSLTTLRDQQLSQLRTGNQDYYWYIRLERVRLHFGEVEPYIEISLHLFNGSVFPLTFHKLEFKGLWNGTALRHLPRVVNSEIQVMPGRLSRIQVEQPVPKETRDSLQRMVETSSAVTWHFEIKGEYAIGDTTEAAQFNTGTIQFQERWK